MFDYWRGREKSLLAEACGADPGVNDLKLEERFPLWRGGTPPHLDVVLAGPDCRPTAIEAKFTEPYGFATNDFRATYFERGEVWQGLPRCRALAERIRDDRERYQRLSAAQLLKHTLGLAKRHGPRGFRLVYLWFEQPGPEAEEHRGEVERFQGSVGDEIDFEVRTYQEPFIVLRRARVQHPEHVGYLAERYFPEGS